MAAQPTSKVKGRVSNQGQRDHSVSSKRGTFSWQQAVVALLLLLGTLLYLAFGGTRGIGVFRWVLIGAAAVAALFPPVSRLIASALDRIRHASAKSPGRFMLLIWLAASGYFILTAVLQQRDLFPKTHDDSSYFLGMQMLAHGRLWMAAHPLADFFESFYILTKPVYCSIYFPGTALLFVPTIWLHLPTWVLPVAASGAATALLYAIITELIDGAAGALAALLLVSLTWFRTYTILLMSQVPMLLLGLLMIWAWLRWRRDKHRWGWLLALGVFSGWAAITRPVDALCFAIPIGIALVLDLLKQPFHRWAAAAALIIAGAVPFLALQIVFDVGVTGRATQTPYTLYLDRDVPGSTFGFHAFDATAEPKSSSPQIHADYRLTKTYLALHQPGNFLEPWFHGEHPPGFTARPAYLTMIAACVLPASILLVLVPVGVLGLIDRRRWVLFATLPTFLVLYLFNPFFLEHYAIPIIPAVILCLLLGMDSAARAWPRFPALATALTAAVVVAALTSFWEINHLVVQDPSKQVSDELLPSATLRQAHELLHGEPAVVLFRWSPGQNWKEEPVYNSEVAWPDDAEVIRAHDLGSRDSEIVDYYARVQPQRMFFVWDLKSGLLRRIGTAADLREAQRQGKDLNALLHPVS